MRKYLLVGGLAVAWLAVVMLTVSWLFPADQPAPRSIPLADVPPLAPVTRTSTIVAPATISIPAVRDAMEKAAPRSSAGKRETPARDLLAGLEMAWTIDRGPLSVAGRPEGLAVTTPLSGVFRVNGQIAGAVGGAAGGAIGALVGNALGRQAEQLKNLAVDQKADIRGAVTVNSKPRLTPGWRIEPVLVANVNITEVNIPIGPARLNVAREVKPFVDKAVGDQMGALEARMRNDPFLEQAARREWARMCRALPLAGAGAGAPDLWLELRPTRAFAAQPRIDAQNLYLVFGVEAQTRVVPAETKPECPFPARLEIVPAAEQGKVDIAVPIDVPFTEVNKLLDKQLAGKTFGEEAGSAVAVTVRRATLAASGDRLLISLAVTAKERKLLGFGTDATVHVWGRPQLDRSSQVMRLTDLTLDVDTDSAFGVLGAAARAAIPYIEPLLAEKAVIDLKPFAADARRKIDAAVADFSKRPDGVRLAASVDDLRLVDVTFDARVLRVIAEAEGTVRVAVTSLPVP